MKTVLIVLATFSTSKIAHLCKRNKNHLKPCNCTWIKCPQRIIQQPQISLKSRNIIKDKCFLIFLIYPLPVGVHRWLLLWPWCREGRPCVLRRNRTAVLPFVGRFLSTPPRSALLFGRFQRQYCLHADMSEKVNGNTWVRFPCNNTKIITLIPITDSFQVE